MVTHDFRVWFIIINAAVNIGVHISFQMSVFVFLRYIPRNGITGLCSISIFSFWGASIVFSIVGAPICFPTAAEEGSFLYTFLPTHVISRLFDSSYSNKYEVIPHCGFDFCFS